MISDIFQAVSDAVTAFAGALADSITSVTSMFYTPANGTNPGSLTVLGTLILIVVGVGLVYWAFRLIKGLLRRA